MAKSSGFLRIQSKKIDTDSNFNKQSNRIDYIDGIRGIASIMVILCHLSCVFLPELYYFSGKHSLYGRIFINSPFNILTNGNAAVQCFFVLSGFLITKKIYRKFSVQSLIKTPIKHYFKLIKIVYPATLFAALLMSCGFMFHLQAANLNTNLNFVLDYNNFTPTLFSAFISEPLYHTFFTGSSYVGPFWTIRFEFWGALLITAVSYFASSHIKLGKLSYIVCGILSAFIDSNIASFFVGAMVLDCIETRKTDTSWIGNAVDWILSKRVLVAILGVLGLYLFCVNDSISGMWYPIRYIPLISHRLGAIRAIGFGLFMICLVEFSILQSFFSLKPLKWLGKISAYTYAFHWPIILSLGCGMYLLFSKTSWSYYMIVLIISISVIISTIIMSFLYTKLTILIANYKKVLLDKNFFSNIRNKIKQKFAK